MKTPNETKDITINLSSSEILRENFGKKFRGYDPVEVNNYLDKIVQDYTTFEKHFSDMYNYIADLELQLQQATSNSTSTSTQNISVDQLDTDLQAKIAVIDKLIAHNKKRRTSQNQM